MATQSIPRPLQNVMFGLTHTPDMQPIVKTPRTVKIGIGTPAGKDILVFIASDGKWRITVGKETKVYNSKDECRQGYKVALGTAPDAKYPKKLPFFTFTRLGANGIFEPDWDTIEQHGPVPTEIDIIFTDNAPLRAAYEMWAARGLQCTGDGINAMRVLAMAATPEEKKLAEEAKARGEKYFPIINGCHTMGCIYAQNVVKGDKVYGPPCKPHGSLSSQLVKAPKLGGKARFDTTAYRSISQLFSCLHEFFSITGQGDASRGFIAGIPLKLVLRPYRVNPEGGTPGTAYGVSLEFRADDARLLHQQLIKAGADFRMASLAPPTLRQLEAPAEDTTTYTIEDDDFLPAEALTDEFYPEEGQQQEELPDPPAQTASEIVQEKTESKQADLAGKLRSKRAAKPAAEPQTVDVAPVAAEPKPAPAAAAQPTPAPVQAQAEPAIQTEAQDDAFSNW